jgi:hypothetical protein
VLCGWLSDSPLTQQTREQLRQRDLSGTIQKGCRLRNSTSGCRLPFLLPLLLHGLLFSLECAPESFRTRFGALVARSSTVKNAEKGIHAVQAHAPGARGVDESG